MPVKSLELLRQNLARADALLPLALVGILSGAFSGLVIIAFRLLGESSFLTFSTKDTAEHFEALSWPWRIGLPVIGGLAVGILMTSVSAATRRVGVDHVMERLAYHAGRLPWRNAVLQFVAATVAIVSGHSVGREGPSIHIGAASASLLGQWLHLPNNSIRILVACGTAAAIAASFNTPIAGVIFAMEVVMMEYTLVGFTPVILAAVSATSMTRLVFGASPIVAAPAMQMASLIELPYMLLVGLVLGTMASLFISSVRRLDQRTRDFPLWLRTTAAGLITGLAALAAPEIMGIGYDTVELALLGALGLSTLVLIVALKLVATTACIGLGVPGGLIGPTVVMGALAGAALGMIGHHLAPDFIASSGFYALLGMGAMMGATLQAPLAALMAILELTANPNSILPGMVVIVTATLTSRVLFGHESIYIDVLRSRGLEYHHDPVAVALSRTGVGAVMNRCFTMAPRGASLASVKRVFEGAPEWIIVADEDRLLAAVNEDQLDRVIAGLDSDDADESTELTAEHGESCVEVRADATLRQALDAMDRDDADVAVITGSSKRDSGIVHGILTRAQIDAAVRYGG
ncbi:MAG: chloride channel protein [Gammaproteobacteria bacterium]|nr:MAG: chloride channel protein [Gammaproteobacteria bacterium]